MWLCNLAQRLYSASLSGAYGNLSELMGSEGVILRESILLTVGREIDYLPLICAIGHQTV